MMFYFVNCAAEKYSLEISEIYLIEINNFTRKGCIKLIKSDSKDIYNVNKYFYFK